MNILYVNGKRNDQLLGVSFYNPTFLYGISCFEGVRAYWSSSKQSLIFLDLKEHLKRLYVSAEHMTLLPAISIHQLLDEVLEIVRREDVREDVYIRITFFIGGDGSWHTVEGVHYMISIRSLPSELGVRPALALGISAYRRISAPSMPPFVKAGANYLNSRYGVLDVRGRGFDDALFLTEGDLLSEASGSTLFLFKGGEIHTPSLECDILPGITRSRLIKLCAENNMHVQEKKIHRDELHGYDGAMLAGTMIEIKPVKCIESWNFNRSIVLCERMAKILSGFIYNRGSGMELVKFNE